MVEVVEPGKTQLGSNQKKEDRMASLKKEIDLDDHTLEVDAFLAKWKVSLDRGLTSDEVRFLARSIFDLALFSSFFYCTILTSFVID